MPSYESKEFKKLQSRWYKKLKAAGFVDLEDKYENLYSPDTRTIAWRNKDAILQFFLKLDSYLTETKRLPKNHRKILKLWSSGMYQSDISKKTHIPLITVKLIIAKYKRKLLAVQ